ncbi:Lsr2 family protein [Micromonospora sp. NPDC048843]|uniref:histone-like nucleoid-structuring protein Lsr2 n=1 Tax=Micromonospora sp. NPDC048843 TaxID=3155389 RepID=UPI0034021887
MAKRVIHQLVDDLDGGSADETIKFALDGVQYEIDLSAANAAKLRDAFSPYTAHGLKVGRSGVARSSRATHSAASGGSSRGGRTGGVANRDQNKAIRDWAKRVGKDISDRGRIPREIVAEYDATAGR